MKRLDEAMSGKPMSPPDPILDPKPPAPPKPAAAPAPPKPMPKELRQEYERVKGELDTRNKAVAEMEAKIADFERRGKDTELLQQRFALWSVSLGEAQSGLASDPSWAAMLAAITAKESPMPSPAPEPR